MGPFDFLKGKQLEKEMANVSTGKDTEAIIEKSQETNYTGKRQKKPVIFTSEESSDFSDEHDEKKQKKKNKTKMNKKKKMFHLRRNPSRRLKASQRRMSKLKLIRVYINSFPNLMGLI
ncbi:uncharacterized protein LOC100679133 [Nasonia vitripennis]|uniref:Uncharacterized protein n=1 Tax=Nasonia vitripennis TaxID=7425 RepID=A0A7M7QKR3_NASVI|nr:uncharacterized protein LOC100679133 [Nasonia vitripennis]